MQQSISSVSLTIVLNRQSFFVLFIFVHSINESGSEPATEEYGCSVVIPYKNSVFKHNEVCSVFCYLAVLRRKFVSTKRHMDKRAW